MSDARVPDGEELTILLAGDGEPLAEGLARALDGRGVQVMTAPVEACVESTIAIAPDLLVLLGTATADGGSEVLGLLSRSSLAAVVPVVLVMEDEALDDRLRAFRYGAAAVVPRTASADAMADSLTRLAREIPERSGNTTGELGEATLDAFVGMLSKELRHGILSVRQRDGDRDDTKVRIVLGEGRSVADVVEQFVAKVQPLVRSAEVVSYELREQPGGTVQLLDGTADTVADADDVAGIRVVLADDDVARADAVGQELRDRGAIVVVTDNRGSRLARAREMDPSVAIVDQAGMHDARYEVVRLMQRDARLRWASLLVVSWDDVWSPSAPGPAVASLTQKLARCAEAERLIQQRASEGKAFDTRLEVLGPGRLLRALVGRRTRLRATVHNRRGKVIIDVSDGLVAGASCDPPEAEGKRLFGPAAISMFLAMANGRVHVEPVQSPASANIMATVDGALASAALEAAGPMPSRPVPAPAAPRIIATTALPTTGVAPKATLHGIPLPDGRPGAVRPKDTRDNTKPGIQLERVELEVPPPVAGLALGDLASRLKLPRPPRPWDLPKPQEDEAVEEASSTEEPRKRPSSRPKRRERTLLGLPADRVPGQAPAEAPEPSPEPSPDEDAHGAASMEVEPAGERALSDAGSDLAPSHTDVMELPPDMLEERDGESEPPPAQQPVFAPAPPPPLPAAVTPVARELPVEVVDPLGPTASVRLPEASGEAAPRPIRGEPTMRIAARGSRRTRWAVAALAAVAVVGGAAVGAWVVLGAGTGTGTGTGTGAGAGTGTETGTGAGAGTGAGTGTGTGAGAGTETGPEAGTGTETGTEAGETEGAADPQEREVGEEADRDGSLPAVALAGPSEVELPEVPERVARMPERTRAQRARQLRSSARRALGQRIYRRAEELFVESLVYEPDNVAAYKGLALMYHGRGDLELSQRWIRRAVRLEPDNPDVWVLLGDSLGSSGDVAGARAAWEAALQADPSHRAARRRLSRIGAHARD